MCVCVCVCVREKETRVDRTGQFPNASKVCVVVWGSPYCWYTGSGDDTRAGTFKTLQYLKLFTN